MESDAKKPRTEHVRDFVHETQAYQPPRQFQHVHKLLEPAPEESAHDALHFVRSMRKLRKSAQQAMDRKTPIYEISSVFCDVIETCEHFMMNASACWKRVQEAEQCSPLKAAELMSTITWDVYVLVRRLSLMHRHRLDSSHRVLKCIADFRCLYVATNVLVSLVMQIVDEDDDVDGDVDRMLRNTRCTALSTTHSGTEVDAVCGVAHGVLWPVDSEDGRLDQWARSNNILVLNKKGVGVLSTCNLQQIWIILMSLRNEWNHLMYTPCFVACLWRVRERLAELSMLTEPSTPMKILNYPGLIDEDNRVVSDTFYENVELVLHAFDIQIASVQHILPLSELPKSIDVEQNVDIFETIAHRELSENDLQRMSVDRDVERLIFDFYVFPGELELFRKSHPYDDVTGMACISIMRQTDFEVIMREIKAPSIAHLWKTSDPNGVVHMLIAARFVQYYMINAFNAENFGDAYFHDASKFEEDCAELLNVDSLYDAAELACIRVECDKDPEASENSDNESGSENENDIDTNEDVLYRHALLPMGTAEQTFRRKALRNIDDSSESLYRHPLIIRVIGAFAVLDVQKKCVYQHTTFVRAFLHWLITMCTDRLISGVLSNGASLAPMLREFVPQCAHVADACDVVFAHLSAAR